MTRFLALALLTAIATPAMAAEAPRTAIVRTADLDLARPEGIATLDRRLKLAARSVCNDLADRTAAGQRDLAACRADALARVRPSRDAMVASARGTEVAVVTTR